MKQPPATFLLVEDDEIDAERLLRAFAKLKITNRVVHRKDGYEALAALRGTDGEPPLKGRIVILLDLNMPRMNGFEFLTELRSDPALEAAPVFVLTTSDRQKDVREAYDRVISGYVVKPVGMGEMVEALSVLREYWTLCELPSI